MIYAILILGGLNALLILLFALGLHIASQERKVMVSAMLAASGKTMASRIASQGTPAQQQALVQQSLDARKEMIENGGTFSAQNPFAPEPETPKKPVGI